MHNRSDEVFISMSFCFTLFFRVFWLALISSNALSVGRIDFIAVTRIFPSYFFLLSRHYVPTCTYSGRCCVCSESLYIYFFCCCCDMPLISIIQIGFADVRFQLIRVILLLAFLQISHCQFSIIESFYNATFN